MACQSLGAATVLVPIGAAGVTRSYSRRRPTFVAGCLTFNAAIQAGSHDKVQRLELCAVRKCLKMLDLKSYD